MNNWNWDADGFDSYLLDKLIDAYSEERNHRDDNHIHASDLFNFCPRRYLLCQITGSNVNPEKYFSVGQKVTHDIGRKVQEFVSAKLRKLDILLEEEAEFKYEIAEHLIVGHADFIIKKDDKAFVVEVKSIKPDAFDALIEAQASHQCQVKSYLWLADVSNKTTIKGLNLDLDKGVVLYVCKLQKLEPFKAFTVEMTSAFKEHMRNIKKVLKAHSKNKSYLPDKLCKTGNAFLAKQCPERNLCFERK